MLKLNLAIKKRDTQKKGCQTQTVYEAKLNHVDEQGGKEKDLMRG